MPAGSGAPLADTVMTRLDELLPASADPVRAVSASAYMRDQFPFLGIAMPTVLYIIWGVMEIVGLPIAK